ncbi:hypothetical protein Q9L58_006983 [Maublancomyces gigas]|uniref:H-type lectin domain-containing protein n=1 Tax=Discina gigas TaxID=1032678 RepID=A0ABR3GDR7_9PEZI
MSSPNPPHNTTPYKPPPYLLAHWTAAELESQFAVFCDSLSYVENAPELVFERLVTGLNIAFDTTASQTRATLDQLLREKKTLQNTVDQLRLELAELNAKNPEKEKPVAVVGDLIRNLPATHLGAPRDIPIEDKWTRLRFKFVAGNRHVNVKVKTSTFGTPAGPGAYTWADIDPVDPEFQSGRETIQSNPTSLLVKTEQKFEFVDQFLTLPKVLVWFTDISYRGPLSIQVLVTELTKTGFTLQIVRGERSILQSVGVGWAAYPVSRTDISCGLFNTRNENEWKYPLLKTSGSIRHHQPQHQCKTLLAVNALDMEERKDFTLEATAKRLYELQMNWDIIAGPKHVRLYSVGITYLIIG